MLTFSSTSKRHILHINTSVTMFLKASQHDIAPTTPIETLELCELGNRLGDYKQECKNRKIM